MQEYKTLHKASEDELIIEKSRFIGYASPVASEEEALDHIRNIKAKHKEATHNVYAYVIGLNNEVQRYNDDGEPSGTAGIPILEVLKKEEIRNAVVVVTRYFGGIKLGAGGLVRAYIKGCKIGLEAAQIVNNKYFKLLHLKIEYGLLGKIQHEISHRDYLIKEMQYDDAVHFYLYVELPSVEKFRHEAMEWSNGGCSISQLEGLYLSDLNGKIILP